MSDRDGLLTVLESKSRVLFLVAGVLLVVYAALNGLKAFSGMDYPILRDSVVRLAGYIIGFVALLGLYPSLADRSPKLARAGAVFAVLGIIGWLVDGLVGTTQSLAVYLGADPPAWTAAFGLLIILGYVLGYVSVGIATLRTGVRSQVLGLLLLMPGIIIVLMLAHIAAGYASEQTAFVISAGQAMTHLAIGAALQTESETADHEEAEPAPDATAR